MKSYLQEIFFRMKLNSDNFHTEISIYDFEGVHISGHKGLIDYSGNEIVVRLKGKNVVICGENLNISEISPDEMIVTGKIKNIGAEYAG